MKLKRGMNKDGKKNKMNLSRKHKKALARQHAWLLFGSYYTGLIGFRFVDTKEYVWDYFQRYGKRYKN